MGLVPFLPGQLVGGLAEPFHGFQFLPHGFHVDAVHLFLGGQQVDLTLPCLGGDFLTAVLQFSPQSSTCSCPVQQDHAGLLFIFVKV